MTSLTPRESTVRKAPQELQPERLRFAGPDRNAQDLPNPVRIDANGDYYGHRNDAAALAHLHVRRIKPQDTASRLRSGASRTR